MKQLSLRGGTAVLLALGTLVAASAAHARSEVHFSVGIQPAQVYVQPAPVYVQPRPVYVQPAPVFVYPGRYPGPRYDNHPGSRGGWYRDHDQFGRVHHDRDYGRHPHHARRFGQYGDLDRDGVVNRRDRDRDGDGVRNRHDQFPHNPYRY